MQLHRPALSAGNISEFIKALNTFLPYRVLYILGFVLRASPTHGEGAAMESVAIPL